ncbi:MAG: hypothetical protein ACRDRI_23885 [Pseudonocardiaceae bacterium]
MRGLLEEAELSNAALGRAVVAAGARERTHVGTNTTSVRRMLDGCQPRWPAPRLIATVLSQRLLREVSVSECGFVDCAPPGEDPYDGLRCSGTLEGTVRTVVELSGRDMRRRKLLLGSVFSAAAFAEPVLFALTVPPAQSTARAAGRRVGMADVEVLIEQTAHLGRLSHQYGSGRVREQMVQLLNREANQLLHGSYSEKTGRALLSAVAGATRAAGFMSGDVGRHALAQRYYIQGLDLAMRAGDRRYGADILQEASRLTVRIGENAPAGQDTLRYGRQAVALARAGLAIAQDTATPALAAKLHAVEARGFALLGDTREARQAVLAAQRCYESVSPEDAARFYSINGFGDDLATCLSRIGDTKQAITLSTMALNGTEPWMVRPLCLVQTTLASTHVLSRDWEQAAAFGRAALRTAASLSSTITVERLHTLQQQVHPLRSSSPHLADLDDRIADTRTRTARRQHDAL